MFGPLGNEFRWAARRLLSTRASTLAALAVLTLGIGAVVTIYTVDRAVLLADLPLPRASQLVVVFRRVGSEVGPREENAQPPTFPPQPNIPPPPPRLPISSI